MASMPAIGQASDVSAEAEAWDLIRDSADPEIFERFLARHPNGAHANDARAKMEALSDTGDVLAPPPTEAVVAAPRASGDNIVTLVQLELQRAGCSPGTPDGDWGGRSKAALSRFVSASGAIVGGSPDAAMLAVLRAHPGRVCTASSATSPSADRPTQPTRSSCITLNVSVTALDYNGDVWDWRINGNPEPDIVIVERQTGLSASCPDSFFCQLTVPNPPDQLSLRITDHDNVSRDQVMADAMCSASKGCSFPTAKVTIGKC
jgi:hypothetical protein